MRRNHFYVGWKMIRITLVLLSLIPFVLAVVGTLRHWVALPYWDEWFSPGTLLLSYAKGTLSFSDLFYQHNESRKAFPYLLYITPRQNPRLGCARRDGNLPSRSRSHLRPSLL